MANDENLGSKIQDRVKPEDNENNIREKRKIRSDSKIDERSKSNYRLKASQNSWNHTSLSFPDISAEEKLFNKERNEVQDREHQSPFEKVREVWNKKELTGKEEKLNGKDHTAIYDQLRISTALKPIMHDPNWRPDSLPIIVNTLYSCCHGNAATTLPSCAKINPCTSACCLRYCRPQVRKNNYAPVLASAKPSCTCEENRILTGLQSPVSREPSFKKQCSGSDPISHRIRNTIQTYKTRWTCNDVIDCDCICPQTFTASCGPYTVDESDLRLYKKTGMIPSGVYLFPRRGWLLPKICFCREYPPAQDDTQRVKVHRPPCRDHHIRCLRQSLCWYRRMCKNTSPPESELDAVFRTIRAQHLQSCCSCLQLCPNKCGLAKETDKVKPMVM